MCDFKTGHPQIGDVSPSVSRNGRLLFQHIKTPHPTHRATSGVTHSRGGTLDHVTMSCLGAIHIKFPSVPALFSDHFGRSFQYSLPPMSTPILRRPHISNSPKYRPNYIVYLSTCLPRFDLFHLMSFTSLWFQAFVICFTHCVKKAISLEFPLVPL